MKDISYRLRVSEMQLNLICEAVEEYFRLRMGQDMRFCDDLAKMDRDISKNNRELEQYIERRNHMHEVMKSLFMIAFEPHGYPKKKTDKMLIAEDIWDVIRVATGQSMWETPLHVGSEPLILIENLGGEEE